MKIDTGVAVCNECGWHSQSVSDALARELGVVHVRSWHPDTYTLVTGKKSQVNVAMLLELQLYTDSEYPGMQAP